MFPMVCKVFAEDLSDKERNIQPCKFLYQSFGLGSVFVKKTIGFWIFKKTQYIDSKLKLQDLLVQEKEIIEDLEEETDVFDWNKILTFNQERKAEGRYLYPRAGARGEGQSHIRALLGQVRKISFPEASIPNRKVDVEHPFIKQIQKKKLSLSLVGKVYRVQNECLIVQAAGSTGNLDVAMFDVINVGGKIHGYDSISLTLSPNTPVAFQPWDISIDKSSGQVTVSSLPGETAGFFENESRIRDKSTRRTELEIITKDLDGLKSLPCIVLETIQALYFTSSFENIESIEPKVKSLEVMIKVTPDEKEKMCKDVKPEQVRDLLIVLCNLRLRREEKQFQSLITLFDATTCITSDLFTIIQLMEPKNAVELLSLFHATFLGETIPTCDAVSNWKIQGMAKLLMENLCSKLKDRSIDENLFSLYMESLFIILYVLFKVLPN